VDEPGLRQHALADRIELAAELEQLGGALIDLPAKREDRLGPAVERFAERQDRLGARVDPLAQGDDALGAAIEALEQRDRSGGRLAISASESRSRRTRAPSWTGISKGAASGFTARTLDPSPRAESRFAALYVPPGDSRCGWGVGSAP